MTAYAPDMTLRDARARYYAANGFGADGGDSERWVEVRVGRFPMWFPNTRGRRYAVKFHDLHHVLTGYPTSLEGETEIGAWEVSTGLGRHYVGWLLDLLAFTAGLGVNPRGVHRAFVRGRHSRNLFSREWDERFLSRTVGEVRRSLGLDAKPRRATAGDNVAFVAWSLAGLAVSTAAFPLLVVPLFVVTLPLRLSRRSDRASPVGRRMK
ncbi:MAG TPA: Coq4 family protein [Pyrinomonadaceae bacterium]